MNNLDLWTWSKINNQLFKSSNSVNCPDQPQLHQFKFKKTEQSQSINRLMELATVILSQGYKKKMMI